MVDLSGQLRCWITHIRTPTHTYLVQNNVLVFIFGTLCSYDPLWRGFFSLGKPRKKRLASLARLIIMRTIERAEINQNKRPKQQWKTMRTLFVTKNRKQKRLKAITIRRQFQVYPGHYISKTGTFCFWIIAWLVGCVFDLVPGCARFWLWVQFLTKNKSPFVIFLSWIAIFLSRFTTKASRFTTCAPPDWRLFYALV